MKKFNLFIALILITILFCSCDEQTFVEKDLQDGKCNTCGGNWYFTKTVCFLNEAYYYYTCDNCGKYVSTPTWFENLKE